MKECGKRHRKGGQVAKWGCRAKEHKVANGTRWEGRGLSSTRWDGARGGGKCREMNLAKVKTAIRSVWGIPGTIGIGRDLCLKPGVECSQEDEGGKC